MRDAVSEKLAGSTVVPLGSLDCGHDGAGA